MPPNAARVARADLWFARIESFDHIVLADDPADPNSGHYSLEPAHVMRRPACGHRREVVAKRPPYATLREPQTEMDAHLLGKG